jgi:hypothetical protein
MFTFNNTLNIVIAMVVVLLVLSLLVQSIQAFIKKIFKLKSKEIEKSLTELFTYIIDKPRAAAPAAPANGAAAGTTTAPPPSITPQKLVGTVLEQFKNVGRYTKWGNVALDSISKEDLMKILARIDSSHFYADYVTKFQSMYQQIIDLETAIKELVKGNLLQGAASAKFAEMREALTPLINDIKSITNGDKIKTEVLLGDLINLRRIKLDTALKLLSEAQESISRDIQAARTGGDTSGVPALQSFSAALTTIAGIIVQLGQQADEAFAVLRSKLDQVDRWYDTVMQSFEERYTRHMKNVALYISIGVVIYFNAGFFRIFRSMSANNDQVEIAEQRGRQLLEAIQKAEAAKTTSNANTNVNVNTNTNSNANFNDANLNSGNSNAGVASNNSNLSPAPTATPDGTSIEDLKKNLAEIQGYSATTQDLGLSPLTWQQLGNWWNTLTDRPLISARWWGDRFGDLKRALDWTLTVLLLSVGAPFWQDTLESLFGVKNLLRKKSDTKNVEQGSGEGQPRP